MLGKKGEDFNNSGNLNTIIGKGSSIDGTMKVNSTLRVDGRVKGNVTTTDSLVIGKDGIINGEVVVRNAIIGGKLKGKLTASGKVILEAKSVFSGELKTTKLVIDEGAVFEGSCSMSAESAEEKKKDLPKSSVAAILEQKQESGEAKEITIAK
ncbi:polymer-forming cytoskeletal protein [candidate division KSB1 bacterium]|nr:polymer-forming cytoskeletal protein [candidate division KSB1 bacterium]